VVVLVLRVVCRPRRRSMRVGRRVVVVVVTWRVILSNDLCRIFLGTEVGRGQFDDYFKFFDLSDKLRNKLRSQRRNRLK